MSNALIYVPATINPYGYDLSCVDDLDPAMLEVGGNIILAQSCARRLNTPRGQLIDDPNFGYDLKQWLGADIDPPQIAQIQGAIGQELLKDQRVLDVKAIAIFTPTTEIMTVTGIIVGAAGPFTLVLQASAVTVSLLAPT